MSNLLNRMSKRPTPDYPMPDYPKPTTAECNLFVTEAAPLTGRGKVSCERDTNPESISGLLDELEKSLLSLADRISNLEGRLEPVLYNGPSLSKDGCSVSDSLNCPMSDALRELLRQSNNISSRVLCILDHLRI